MDTHNNFKLLAIACVYHILLYLQVLAHPSARKMLASSLFHPQLVSSVFHHQSKSVAISALDLCKILDMLYNRISII